MIYVQCVTTCPQAGDVVKNPFCQSVTCVLGGLVEVTDPQCADHAFCVPGGEFGYHCVCGSGYVGDGVTSCTSIVA